MPAKKKVKPPKRKTTRPKTKNKPKENWKTKTTGYMGKTK